MERDAQHGRLVSAQPKVALIQGGTGGLGRALAEALLESGRFDELIITTRDPSRVTLAHPTLSVVQLDLSSDASIHMASRQVAARCDHLSLVVTTAGLLSDPARGIAPEKKLSDLNRATLHALFEVNCFGPFLWYQALIPLLRRRAPVTVATLSARVGSISDNRLGGWYSYRSSKAAQNMMTKTFSLELGRLNPQSIVVGLHPGTVDTPLSQPFQARVPADKLFTPERAAQQLLEVLHDLSPADSGRCFAWDGQEIQP